jgi:hypothetical protein
MGRKLQREEEEGTHFFLFASLKILEFFFQHESLHYNTGRAQKIMVLIQMQNANKRCSDTAEF